MSSKHAHALLLDRGRRFLIHPGVAEELEAQGILIAEPPEETAEPRTPEPETPVTQVYRLSGDHLFLEISDQVVPDEKLAAGEKVALAEGPGWRLISLLPGLRGHGGWG